MKKRLHFLIICLTYFSSTNAQTLVTGNITGNWNLAGSPYVVIGNINIVDSLIIDEGVSVLFNGGGWSITIGANDKFIARGTCTNPIQFRAYTGQNPGTWNGLIFSGSGNNDSLFFCDIQNATTGIMITGASGTYLSDCKIHINLNYGIEVLNTASPFIQNCYIYENLMSGIYAHTTSNNHSCLPKIFQCVIVQNCFSGIEVLAAISGPVNPSSVVRPEISNCILAFNSLHGLDIKNPSAQQTSDAIIYNSIIAYNGNYGISRGNSTQLGTNDVTYNCFWQNGLGQFYGLSGTGFGCAAQTGQYLNANNIPCDINFNICYDPLFTDINCLRCNNGYNLLPTSNCINSATNIIFGQFNLNITDIGATALCPINCTSPCPAAAAVIPSVTISASPGTSICIGTSVTFTAVPTNGGTSPVYQWKRNGLNVGSNSPTYTSSALVNGDVISCVLTGNASCATSVNTTSNSITITVNPMVLPVVTINVSNDTVCYGLTSTFNATGTNAGINPTYEWKKNASINMGTGTQLITANIQNGDVISCILTSSEACASPNPVTSNNITMTVNPNNFNVDFVVDTAGGDSCYIFFTNATPFQNLYTYTWYFGDGTTSFQNDSIYHTYAVPDTFSVVLMAQSMLTGCIDTITKSDIVNCGIPDSCNFNVSVSPAGVVNGCINGSITLSALSNATNPTYQWLLNGVIIGGATQPTYTTGYPGLYSVMVYNDGSCPRISSVTTLSFNAPPNAAPTITSSGQITSCGQGSCQLTANAPGAQSFLWNTGETSAAITVTQSGSYNVIATYGLGCEVPSLPFIINNSAAVNPGICMVTVDTLSNKNKIIWEAPSTSDIDSFFIYKETNQANVYIKIGAVGYPDLSEFTDTVSDPQTQGFRYKIAAFDSCGGLTPQSDLHKTIHLQVFPGVGYDRQLSWSSYEGLTFASYEIRRKIPPASTFSYLTTIASNLNTYTDNSGISPDADYRVEIVMPQTCNSATRVAYGKSKSNIKNNPAILVVGSPDKKYLLGNVVIIPNPSNGNIHLQWESLLDQQLKVTVNDILGKTVLTENIFAKTGLNTLPISVKYSGIYLVSIYSENGARCILKMIVN